jgi:hypothetical protein
MTDDYAKATAAPGYVRIGAVEYRARKFSPRDIGDCEAWLKQEFPDPRMKARELCAGMSDAVALVIWQELSEEATDWPVAAMSAKGSYHLMFTWEGNAYLAWAAFRRNQADITLDRAREITADATTEEIAALVRAVFPEETFLPKDPASTATK